MFGSRRFFALFAAALLSSCGRIDDQEFASGRNDAVARVTQAASACGVTAFRLDPLDEKNTLMLVGKGTPNAARECLRRWVRQHEQAVKLTPA